MEYPAVQIDTAGDELNRLHKSIEGKLRSTVDDAIRAGEILTQVKERLNHGDFLPWIQANCSFSRQTADNYRRLYSYSGKMPTGSNLQEAYQQIETIERQEQQTEEQRARQRVNEYLKTGIKPEGWRRGTDDKIAEEERARSERIDNAKAKLEEESRKREERRRERDSTFDAFESFNDDILREALERSSESYNKRQEFKERIRLSQSGESDVFIDALMDYLNELEDDNRRIEACQNIIKVCKGIAVDLQAGKSKAV